MEWKKSLNPWPAEFISRNIAICLYFLPFLNTKTVQVVWITISGTDIISANCFHNNMSTFLVYFKGLGLGLQGLYSATNCADNILGRFTIILQNQISRVDSFTNLTKRWVFRFRLNASISSDNLISFGKHFHARGPYTANARLPKVSCLNFGTFRTRSLLDLMEYLLLFDGVIISWM